MVAAVSALTHWPITSAVSAASQYVRMLTCSHLKANLR